MPQAASTYAVGTPIEVKQGSEWRRGVVLGSAAESGLVLVKMRPTGSKYAADGATRWSFSDCCRPDGKRKAAPAPAPTPAPTPTSDAVDSRSHFVDEPAPGLCVGTLRWDEGLKFPKLPPWPLPAGDAPPSMGGWRDYLSTRLPPDSKGTIRVEPPMLDGCSYPLTLVHVLQLLRFRPPQPGPLHILAIGASSKAEERLLRDSNYWDELCHFLPGTSLELVFVGPEIAAARHKQTVKRGPRLTARSFRGTLGQLLAAEPERYTPSDTLVVGFNTGMGSGLYALMRSWLPDLLALLRRGFVGIFSCANDYSDLKGEVSVFVQLLHAKLVLAPRPNPFKAATVVRENDGDDATGDGDERAPPKGEEWSCSSCYVYAVQGRKPDAPALPPDAEAALQPALKKLAARLRATCTPSPVP